MEIRLGYLFRRAGARRRSIQGAGRPRHCRQDKQEDRALARQRPGRAGCRRQDLAGTRQEFGYEVVQNAEFPVDNAQFTSIIAEAKSKGADIVMVDAITPAGDRDPQADGGGRIHAQGPQHREGRRARAIRRSARQTVGRRARRRLLGSELPLSRRGGPRQGVRKRDQALKQPAYRRIPMRRRRSCSTRSRRPARPIRRRSTRPSPRRTRPMSSGRSSSTRTIPRSCQSSRCQWQNGKTVIVWPKAQKTGDFLFPLP